MHLKSRSAIANFTCILFIGILACFAMPACKRKEEKKPIPNALEDRSIDVTLLSKRSGKDLMENLYDELEERNEILKQLEEDVADIQKMKTDSISLFKRFDNKSRTYYDAAMQHAGTIQDSLLRLKIRQIIDSSIMTYKQLAASDTLLITQIEQSHARLEDLYIILKIVKTLPIMERYQKEYLPADSMLRNILERYEALGARVDSLSR